MNCAIRVDSRNQIERSNFLEGQERPPEIQARVDSAYAELKKKVISNWGSYNGDKNYKILEIEDSKLIKKIIATSSKKEFWFLDIGAGKFQWGKNQAELINEQKDILDDTVVHFVGIRGEGGESSQETIGKCILHQLTGSKVEDLILELAREGLFLENKVDLVVSRWCFRHLVDPRGTFERTLRLLCPETGLLLMDGFFFMDRDDIWQTFDEPDTYMITLLFHTKAPFLIQPYQVSRSLDRFILRKPSANPCQVSLHYRGFEENCTGKQIASEVVTKFDLPEEKKGWEIYEVPFSSSPQNYLYGDESLYQWLKKDELIPSRMKKGLTKAEYKKVLSDFGEDCKKDPSAIPNLVKSSKYAEFFRTYEDELPASI